MLELVDPFIMLPLNLVVICMVHTPVGHRSTNAVPDKEHGNILQLTVGTCFENVS